MRWVATNLALFVAVEAVYAALLGLLVESPKEVGATLFAVAMLFTTPLLPIYLATVAALPANRSPRRQRIVAVAASPLLLSVFIFLAFAGGSGPFLLAVALPGALTYGALVRLRETSRTAALGTWVGNVSGR